ncbi:MAG: YifB family Mg chelatase-like AAA ATPase [Clostridia bacterium]|nr:YifB family Mg chelatase-like AAA ATPase [Clostridia bacterium]
MIRVKTAVLHGIEGQEVSVEVDLKNGLPGLIVIGLGDTVVKEATERIKGAIINSGYHYPHGKIIVNLAPADLRKRGSHMELAVAIGILGATGQVNLSRGRNCAFFGELSLSGEILPIKGLVPLTYGLKNRGKYIIPRGNYYEKDLIQGEILPFSSLKAVCAYLNYGEKEDIPDSSLDDELERDSLDFADVHGQEQLKRAALISAAGHHPMLMVGSPGTGKTMVARRIPSLLGEMSQKEMVETGIVYSVLAKKSGSTRPFREPYYRISQSALTGGGQIPLPGEISLAHNGVLFLDELGEYDNKVLNALRTPIEDKKISISRQGDVYTFPCDFLLIAAANPCKCGYLGDDRHKCTCTAAEIENYKKKLAGPLANRIDINIFVPNIDYDAYRHDKGLSTEEMLEVIERARLAQERRYKDLDISYNSQLQSAMIDKYCKLSEDCERVLKEAYDKFKLNPRTCEKVIKLARTIADIEGKEDIELSHIMESLSYRSIENLYGGD